MPRTQKLKVYCTPIGFHNAYVAALSQKAALEAWGSDANLFARGVAEQVTDPKLMAEPVAHPGKVIRRLRGTPEEQVAALPAEKPAPKAPKRIAKPKPRPSRAALEEAERTLTELEERQHEERERFARREAELARERHELEERQRKELDRATKARNRVEESYEKALAKWRG